MGKRSNEGTKSQKEINKQRNQRRKTNAQANQPFARILPTLELFPVNPFPPPNLNPSQWTPPSPSSQAPLEPPLTFLFYEELNQTISPFFTPHPLTYELQDQITDKFWTYHYHTYSRAGREPPTFAELTSQFFEKVVSLPATTNNCTLDDIQSQIFEALRRATARLLLNTHPSLSSHSTSASSSPPTAFPLPGFDTLDNLSKHLAGPLYHCPLSPPSFFASMPQTSDNPPYQGNIRALSWNTRAFNASTISNYTLKHSYLSSILPSVDIACLQDTHSNPNDEAAMYAYAHKHQCLPVITHETTSRGGLLTLIGPKILKIARRIYAFDVIEQRAQVILVYTTKGLLQIMNCYLDPGSPQTRQTQIKTLATYVHSQFLTVLQGGFNFTVRDVDRHLLPNQTRPLPRLGHHNEPELSTFTSSFPRFEEILQWDHTYVGTAHTSRIDRCYTNHHPALRIMKHFEATALFLPKSNPRISDHRPLKTIIKASAKSQTSKIPNWIIHHPKFKEQTQTLYERHELRSSTNPFERLHALNISIQTAANMVRKLPPQQAISKENQLGTAISLYSQLHHKATSKLQKYANIDTALHDIIQQYPSHPAQALAKLSDHIYNLHHEFLHELSSNNAHSSKTDTSKKSHENDLPSRSKDPLAKRLLREFPGVTNSLHTVEDPRTENYTQSPPHMASICSQHWAKVFGPKPFNASRYQQAASNYQKRLPSGSWQVTWKIVREVWASLPNSSPGPNGIPFSAYKQLATEAQPIFYDLIEELMDPQGHPPPPDFNHALLFLLPKKPSSTHPRLGPAYTPANTRPISVVNTDNRIIASILNRILLKFALPFCSPTQRGFLTGRNIATNVIDMNSAVYYYTANHPLGALLLFDFNAAFPSLSHDYLWKILSHIGVPPYFLQAIRSLYHQNSHSLVISGQLFPSSTLQSGVRQGCPLSPTLFVLALDLLLTQLETNLGPAAIIRAFADDIGLVTNDILRDLPTLHSIFSDFSSFSALNLNTGKTLLLPFSTPSFSLRSTLAKLKWDNIDCSQTKAKYLGIMIGPAARPEDTINQVLEKFQHRLQHWKQYPICASYKSSSIILFFTLCSVTFVSSFIFPHPQSRKSKTAFYLSSAELNIGCLIQFLLS